MKLVGVGGRFAHECPGRGCAVCHWVERQMLVEIFSANAAIAHGLVVGGGKMEGKTESKACGNADDS